MPGGAAAQRSVAWMPRQCMVSIASSPAQCGCRRLAAKACQGDAWVHTHGCQGGPLSDSPPLASMEKETLILGTPRGAGGMPAGSCNGGAQRSSLKGRQASAEIQASGPVHMRKSSHVVHRAAMHAACAAWPACREAAALQATAGWLPADTPPQQALQARSSTSVGARKHARESAAPTCQLKHAQLIVVLHLRTLAFKHRDAHLRGVGGRCGRGRFREGEPARTRQGETGPMPCAEMRPWREGRSGWRGFAIGGVHAMWGWVGCGSRTAGSPQTGCPRCAAGRGGRGKGEGHSRQRQLSAVPSWRDVGATVRAHAAGQPHPGQAYRTPPQHPTLHSCRSAAAGLGGGG